MVDRYLRTLENSILPNSSFGYDGLHIYSYEELRRLYHEDYQDWPFYQRVEQLKKHLRQRLISYKTEYLEELEQQCAQRIGQVKQAMEDESETRRLLITRLIEEKDHKVQRMNLFTKQGVQEYFKKIKQHFSIYNPKRNL